MPRFAANDVKVVVRGIDLSDHADSVDTPEEKEQIDVSGFSPTNAKSFVPGPLDQTIEVEFLQDFDAQKVHNILYPLFTSGTTFGVYVQPDSDTGVSTTNPTFGGTAQLFSYNGLGGAALGEPVKITATFKPTSGATFVWGTATYS